MNMFKHNANDSIPPLHTHLYRCSPFDLPRKIEMIGNFEDTTFWKFSKFQCTCTSFLFSDFRNPNRNELLKMLVADLFAVVIVRQRERRRAQKSVRREYNP